MNLVLDASVAIAAARPSEPFHALARARVNRALRGDDTLVLPSFFVVEVAGALARIGEPLPAIRHYLDLLTQAPHSVLTIGLRRAQRARDVAMACRLRGPDAIYVWLASSKRIPLCTLDVEMATRGATACQVIQP